MLFKIGPNILDLPTEYLFSLVFHYGFYFW